MGLNPVTTVHVLFMLRRKKIQDADVIKTSLYHLLRFKSYQRTYLVVIKDSSVSN